MKIKIILIAAMLAVSGFAKAQVNKDAFEKAVDLLNCKTVALSLDRNENNQEYQKQCPCGNATYTKIKQFLTSVGKLDATIALSDEVESLKKSFKESWNKDEVVSFLSDTIFVEKIKYQKISAFAEKRKSKPEFDTYKVNLKKDLANLFAEVKNIPQTNVIPTNTSNEQLSKDGITALDNNQNTGNVNGFLGGLSDYLIILAIILGSVSIFLSLRRKGVNDIYDAIIPKILESNRLQEHIQSQSGFARSTSANLFNPSELRDANNRIRDLEFQVKNLNEKLLSSENHVTQTPPRSFQDSIHPEVKPEIFFLSTPNSDGSFNDSSVSPVYKEGASIYKFTKVGNNRAQFQIDERENSIKFALTYPDKSILPVCDSINEYESKYTRIVTLKTGMAELQNGKWIVNKSQKAKIRYES